MSRNEDDEDLLCDDDDFCDGNLHDQIYKPYNTIRYKYFRHRMTEIFPIAEKNGFHGDEETNPILDINFSFNDLEFLYKTHELRDSDLFKYLIDEPIKSFAKNEIDFWIENEIHDQENTLVDLKLKSKPRKTDEQKNRYMFFACFVISMRNVFRLAAMAIPELGEFRRIYKITEPEDFFDLCTHLVQIKNDEYFHIMDIKENIDLPYWIFDAVSQYSLGFTLGLEGPKGKNSKRAGLIEGELDTLLLNSQDTELNELFSREFKKTSSYELGVNYENECLNILEEAGFNVETTPSSGDQGADLICQKEGLQFVIQCKNMDRVGNKAIQEVLASMKYYQADFAVVATPGEFTRAARELAGANQVILIKSEKLKDLFYIAR